MLPRLRRLSDAEPTTLVAALHRVWRDGGAAIVLPDDAPDDAIPPAVAAALAGDLETPAGTALVVPTSGSTGTPRAIALDHRGIDAAVEASLARLDCRHGERWALALPVRHIAGLMVLLRAEALGTAPLVIADPGDPAAVATASDSAPHIALVPTQLVRALEVGVDLSRFRTVLLGGGPIAGPVLERARAAGVRVVTTYGMTESCGGCVYDGVPLDGTEVDIGSGGRIRLRGPSISRAELGGAQLTDGAGWFETADLGRLVGDRLEVIGRADSTILSGGVNIDPAAVEGVLRTHPAVVDAVVVAIDDPMWGQACRAVVVARDDVRLSELRASVGARLGRTHAPRELLRVAAIPRDDLGKVTAATRAVLAAAEPTEVYSPA